MKKLKFTPTKLNKRGKEAHAIGTVHDDGVNGLCFYGWDRIPRKLKKQAKRKINGGMIWIYGKPDATQKRDPGFMWLETFKTIL